MKGLTFQEYCEKECLDAIDELTDVWSVYLVGCSDGTLYCGISNNVTKRIRNHNAGDGAKYTKTRLPVSLVYFEEVGSMSDAMKRERQIKKMSRKQKLDLCKSL